MGQAQLNIQQEEKCSRSLFLVLQWDLLNVIVRSNNFQISF